MSAEYLQTGITSSKHCQWMLESIDEKVFLVYLIEYLRSSSRESSYVNYKFAVSAVGK